MNHEAQQDMTRLIKSSMACLKYEVGEESQKVIGVSIHSLPRDTRVID